MTLEFRWAASGRLPGNFLLAPGFLAGSVRISRIVFARGDSRKIEWKGEKIAGVIVPVFGISDAHISNGVFSLSNSGKFARLSCRADWGSLLRGWEGEAIYRALPVYAYSGAAFLALLAGLSAYFIHFGRKSR